MNRKALTIKSMDEAGTGIARIAILSAVDRDGDTYQPGAFSWKEGGHQWVQILPAHDWRAMPLGKARVYEAGDEVLADLSLNLDTQAGRDWHAALKFDLAKGTAIQEWSYGFDVIDMDYQVRGDSRIRVLKQLDVMEVSPVLRGAGVGTGTVAMKGAALLPGRFDAVITDLADMAAAIDGDPTRLSATGLKQLTDIHAAMGKVLGGETPPKGDPGLRPEDAAVGDFMRRLARHHLPA